jgi:hypothetical protein
MAMRRALGLGAVAAAAGLALWRARGGRPREHVDLYFADGSMVSLVEASPEAARLLGLGRDVLAAAR